MPDGVDFIVVGGGSAGAVIASRLSEDPACKVALIEAGEQPPEISALPIAPAAMQLDPATDWMFTADPGKAGLGLNGGRVPVPRGKMLGGSSGINYMMYVRGHPGDFCRSSRSAAATLPEGNGISLWPDLAGPIVMSNKRVIGTGASLPVAMTTDTRSNTDEPVGSVVRNEGGAPHLIALQFGGTDGTLPIPDAGPNPAAGIIDCTRPGATSAPLPLPLPVARDFNGDGTSDILWSDTSGNVAIWLINDNSAISTGIIGFADPTWRVPATGDFNGDGTTDILWFNGNGSVAAWIMSDGTPSATSIIGFAAPATWRPTVTGDSNADGTSDILWQSRRGPVALWQMSDGTPATTAIIGYADPTWHIRGFFDLTGDGQADVLWHNDNGNVGMWVINDGTVAATELLGSASSSWHIRGDGDFNGDGTMDILWQDDTGAIEEWLIVAGTATAAGLVGFSADPNIWSIHGVEDHNGDGKADILWQDTAGNVDIWNSTGTGFIAASFTGAADPAAWSIEPLRPNR